MRVKNVIYEDLTNYKKPAMFIGNISCSGKCCVESKLPMSICQNDALRNAPIINMPNKDLISAYMGNPLTSAIVFGGLEPFEQYQEILEFVAQLRTTFNCDDDIVIYTGYNFNEIECEMMELSVFKNIVIKLGRYIPNRESVYDPVLGITLASDNQYAIRL